eukprot:gene30375-19230_t
MEDILGSLEGLFAGPRFRPRRGAQAGLAVRARSEGDKVPRARTPARAVPQRKHGGRHGCAGGNVAPAGQIYVVVSRATSPQGFTAIGIPPADLLDEVAARWRDEGLDVDAMFSAAASVGGMYDYDADAGVTYLERFSPATERGKRKGYSEGRGCLLRGVGGMGARARGGIRASLHRLRELRECVQPQPEYTAYTRRIVEWVARGDGETLDAAFPRPPVGEWWRTMKSQRARRTVDEIRELLQRGSARNECCRPGMSAAGSPVAAPEDDDRSDGSGSDDSDDVWQFLQRRGGGAQGGDGGADGNDGRADDFTAKQRNERAAFEQREDGRRLTVTREEALARGSMERRKRLIAWQSRLVGIDAEVRAHEQEARALDDACARRRDGHAGVYDATRDDAIVRRPLMAMTGSPNLVYWRNNRCHIDSPVFALLHAVLVASSSRTRQRGALVHFLESTPAAHIAGPDIAGDAHEARDGQDARHLARILLALAACDACSARPAFHPRHADGARARGLGDTRGARACFIAPVPASWDGGVLEWSVALMRSWYGADWHMPQSAGHSALNAMRQSRCALPECRRQVAFPTDEYKPMHDFHLQPGRTERITSAELRADATRQDTTLDAFARTCDRRWGCQCNGGLFKQLARCSAQQLAEKGSALDGCVHRTAAAVRQRDADRRERSLREDFEEYSASCQELAALCTAIDGVQERDPPYWRDDDNFARLYTAYEAQLDIADSLGPAALTQALKQAYLNVQYWRDRLVCWALVFGMPVGIERVRQYTPAGDVLACGLLRPLGVASDPVPLCLHGVVAAVFYKSVHYTAVLRDRAGTPVRQRALLHVDDINASVRLASTVRDGTGGPLLAWAPARVINRRPEIVFLHESATLDDDDERWLQTQESTVEGVAAYSAAGKRGGSPAPSSPPKRPSPAKGMKRGRGGPSPPRCDVCSSSGTVVDLGECPACHGEEVRRVPDGEKKTRAEFVDFFGGSEEWDEAVPGVIPPGAAPAAALDGGWAEDGDDEGEEGEA